MIFKRCLMSLALCALVLIWEVDADEKWSWGKDASAKSTGTKQIVSEPALVNTNLPESRQAKTKGDGVPQGRSFGIFKKLGCKLGLCEHEPIPYVEHPFPLHPGPVPFGPGPFPVGPGPFPVGPGPFPVGPGQFPVGPGPFPVGPGPFPVGPGPFPLGPTPILGPIPAPLPIPAPAHVNIHPQALLPHHNQGYPPIKPTKTELHHHVHTHIHKGSGSGHVISPFKDTGYPPKKSGFSPTIVSGGSQQFGLGTHINHNKGFGFKPIAGQTHINPNKVFGIKPIAVQPEAVTGSIYRPTSSLYSEHCLCVQPQQCSPFDVVRRSGGQNIAHLLNPRSEGLSILSNATSSESARFKRDTLITNRQPKSALPQTPKGRAVGGHLPGLTGCGHNYVCCRNSLNNHIPNPHHTCGRSYKSSSIHGRVANTDYDRGTTQFGQYPWQGAILRNENHNSVFVCGATLVSAQHVLTAAHCIVDESPYNLKIRLGDWDVNGETEFYKHVDLPIQKVTIHPDFYSGNLNNDIAIITLQGYVDFHSQPHISPICLPEPYADFTHQHCYVTGWGKDAFGYSGQFQQILKEVDVPIVERHTCQYALQQAKLGPDYYLPKGFICAGGQEGKDTCKGDGGGPLVCPTSFNTYELAGIVSWGIECGIKGVPGVYVNIPYYVEWIKSYINY